MTEGKEAVKEAKKFLKKAKPCPTCGRKPCDLVITTVPKQALLQFSEFSNSDEFGGHRGFALKFLLDFYLGRIPTGLPELENEVEILREEISEKDTQKEEKIIRSVSGEVLNIAK